jgi:hypothetical protein
VAHVTKTLQRTLRTTRNNKAYDYADDNGGDLRKAWSFINEIFSGTQPRQDVKVQKMGTDLLPKTSEAFTSRGGCVPEKISLYSVAAKASRLIRSLITDDQNYVLMPE